MFCTYGTTVYPALAAIALLVRPKLHFVALYLYLCNDNKVESNLIYIYTVKTAVIFLFDYCLCLKI